MAGLPVVARLYLAVVVAVAFGVVGFHLHRGFDAIVWGHVLVLGLLFHYCEVSSVRLTVHHVRASMSYAVGAASAVLVGPGAAAFIGLTAVGSLQQGMPVVKRVFNGAQYALSGYAAAVVFGWVGAGWGGEMTRRAYLGFGVALVTFVGVNLLLVGGMLLVSRQATVPQLRREFRQLVLPALGNGAFGLVLVGLWPEFGPYAALLVMVPLIAGRWALAVPYAEAKACQAAMAALCQAVEIKDPPTRGHCLRVSEGVVRIAEHLGLEAERMETLRQAGLMHDVGKTAVPTAILQKPGKPTEEEWVALQLHPWHGGLLIKDIDFLQEAVGGVMHHHERMDGRGYPVGLVGEEIPEFARIIAVADFFDAVTTERPYHRPWSREKAIAEIEARAGTHFDPRMVAAFIRGMETGARS